MDVGETVPLLHGDGSVINAQIIKKDRGEYVLESPGIPIPLYLSEKTLLKIIQNARKKLAS